MDEKFDVEDSQREIQRLLTLAREHAKTAHQLEIEASKIADRIGFVFTSCVKSAVFCPSLLWDDAWVKEQVIEQMKQHGVHIKRGESYEEVSFEELSEDELLLSLKEYMQEYRYEEIGALAYRYGQPGGWWQPSTC